MNNQTWDLQLKSQLIESDFLESDLESGLLPDNEANILERDRLLELKTNLNSTDHVDLFANLEEASPLYSESSTEDDNPEQTDNNDLEVSDAAPTKSITVGSDDETQFTFNFAADTPQK